MANKKAAPEDKLGDLHNKVADVFIGVLDNFAEANAKNAERIAEWNESDEETGAPLQVVVVEPSAAFLNAATKFLKDNEVTAAPAKDNEMSELERKLEENRKRRGNVVNMSGVPLAEEA